MVKNPAANAGDMGSIPGLGRSHMLHAQSPCATTIECVLLQLMKLGMQLPSQASIRCSLGTATDEAHMP